LELRREAKVEKWDGEPANPAGARLARNGIKDKATFENIALLLLKKASILTYLTENLK
jgi:hypothetical protein